MAILTRASAATMVEPSERENDIESAFQLVYEGYSKARDAHCDDHGYITFLRGKLTSAFGLLQRVTGRAKWKPYLTQKQAEPSERTAHEIVAEQQRTHEFVQFADRTRYVADIDPKKGVKPYSEAAQQQAEPGADERAVSDAYDKVDRFLRNNLDDVDYAEYSEALECVRIAQSGQRAGVAEDVIEAAAKKLAEDFDYPWEHMPAQGKDDFRAKVRSIAAMLAAPTQQQEGQ